MTDASATIIASFIGMIGCIAAAIINRKLKLASLLISLFVIIAGIGMGVLIGYLLLLRPHASARISEPKDGQSVPINTTISSEYKNIPQDRHLWIAIRIPGVGAAGTWLVYPETESKDAPKLKYGKFEAKEVQFGGDTDMNRPFNVVILLADEGTNIRLVDYKERCAKDSNLCNGMPLPEEGIEILDFNTVIRK